jgi:hypothetical protein
MNLTAAEQQAIANTPLCTMPELSEQDIEEMSRIERKGALEQEIEATCEARLISYGPHFNYHDN